MAINNSRTPCNHRYYEDKGLRRKLYLCTLRHGYNTKQKKCLGQEHESCPLNLYPSKYSGYRTKHDYEKRDRESV